MPVPLTWNTILRSLRLVGIRTGLSESRDLNDSVDKAVVRSLASYTERSMSPSTSPIHSNSRYRLNLFATPSARPEMTFDFQCQLASVAPSVEFQLSSFQFPSNGKVFPNWRCDCIQPRVSFNSLQTGRSFRTIQKYDTESLVFSFNSLQTGRSFRTAPSANPVVVRAKIAKTKHELRGVFFLWKFFFVKIIIKNLTNPYEHWTKREILNKQVQNPIVIYVLEQFYAN